MENEVTVNMAEFREEYNTVVGYMIHKERFYASLLQVMKLKVGNEIPTAAVSIDKGINLYINPEFFMSLDFYERVDVLKHECKHIYHNHIARYLKYGIDKQSRKSQQKRANIAMDASINYDLHHIIKKEGIITVPYLNKKLKEVNPKSPDLEDKMTFEYYFQCIEQFAQDNKSEFGEGEPDFDDHSKWSESKDSPEVIQEITRQAVNKAVERAGGIGNVPGDVALAVGELNKSEVDWKKQFRHIVSNASRSDKITTRNRRNRRYGITVPGNKKEPKMKIVISTDTSGSMVGERLEQCWAEISKIKKNFNAEVWVVECDTQVHGIYEFHLKKKPEFKGAGGTCVQPGIDAALQLDPDIVIYLTDGDYFDKPVLSKKVPFIWAIVGTGKSTVNADFGRVIDVKISSKV